MALHELYSDLVCGKISAEDAINRAHAMGIKDNQDNAASLIEKVRIEGILLGLAMARKSYSEGTFWEAVHENEVYYKEELELLQYRMEIR